jgi:RNA polymerase sigma-70 factor (ECF subfamily)
MGYTWRHPIITNSGSFVTFSFFPRYIDGLLNAVSLAVHLQLGKDTLMKNEGNRVIPGEAALVEAARHDAGAFAALYRQYLNSLYRYLLRRLNNVHDTEDLTSQVFMQALEGLAAGQYQNEGCFAAWLFTIARRRLVDFYRQHPSATLKETPSPEPGLLAAIEKGQDLQRLARLLSLLEEDQQELLRLRFSAGLSFAQISMLDGRNEAAVKMAVYRTLEFLREQWEAENE